MRAIGLPELIVIAFVALIFVLPILAIVWLLATRDAARKHHAAFCPSCGHPASSTARFCPACGKPGISTVRHA
jgi:hypothetical protein